MLMRTYPCTHWFNALPPILDEDEEEIWFRHPKFPLQCNQLGMVLYDDEVIGDGLLKGQLRIKFKDHAEIIGYKEKIVMECYHQISYSHHIFFHIDSNPLNFCEENLIGFRIRGPEFQVLKKRQKEFWNKSLDYMESRRPFIEKRGIKPEDYWALMDLPRKLLDLWKDHTNGIVRVPPPLGRKPLKTNRDEDRVEGIWERTLRGMSSRQIAKDMGISRTNVLYWLKKINEGYDI